MPHGPVPESVIAVSALTGEGIAELREAILPKEVFEQESGFITSLRHERLLRESGSGTREMVEHALLPHLHQLPAAATLGSSEAIARCVAQGLGVSCLSRVLVQALVASGELAVLPTTLPRMWRDFSLVQRAGKRRSPALAAFVQACLQHAQD